MRVIECIEKRRSTPRVQQPRRGKGKTGTDRALRSIGAYGQEHTGAALCRPSGRSGKGALPAVLHACAEARSARLLGQMPSSLSLRTWK